MYFIITEDNAGQYYPDYAYNHPLFTQNMKIYSDSTVSAFLQSVTEEQNAGFLNEWNGSRSHHEKIYISYDSTNKKSQAGDVELVEYGKPKVDIGIPVFNYAMGYDVNNRELCSMKNILNAFGLTDKNMEYRANWISEELKKSMMKQSIN